MHRLHSHDDLLDLSGGDPWVRWSLAAPLQTEAWAHEGVALVERVGRRRGFWVVPFGSAGAGAGAADRLRSALVTLRDEGHLDRLGSQSVSVPQQHAAVAHEVLDLTEGGDWDWMWTTTPPPPQVGEDRVVELDDARDAEELLTFSRRHNPRVWTEIGTGRVQRWVGIRDTDGALVAVGGAETETSGIPHLAGIVTDTALRGQGLGTAVSTHLTRWALAGHGVSTLGMFSDNAAARRVYDRMGYRTAHAWHSRGLAGR